MNKKEMGKWIRLLPLFMAAGAFWRRWYGGGFKNYLKDSRFWKYTVLIVVCFTMLYVKMRCFTFLGEFTTYEQIVSFAFHWAEGHGDYFFVWDTGRDEGRIRWIDWALRRIYGKGNYYCFKGNVTGLVLRYGSTSCLVALCLGNPLFCLSGLLTPLSYVITGKMENPTNKAEFLAGALNFALFYLCL